MAGLDTLVPGAARPDPSEPPLAALGAMFPYLRQPTGLASMQPNAAGKLPEVDPLASWQPIAQGALDVASFLGPEIAAKGMAGAALHLVPLARYKGLTNYKVIDDLAKHVIDLKTTFNPESKQLYIDWVGLPQSSEQEFHQYMAEAPNALGPKEVRSLVTALRSEYPEMTSLTGTRISGARAAASGKRTADPMLKFKGPPTESYTRPEAVEAALDENARRLLAEKARANE